MKFFLSVFTACLAAATTATASALPVTLNTPREDASVQRTGNGFHGGLQ